LQWQRSRLGSLRRYGDRRIESGWYPVRLERERMILAKRLLACAAPLPPAGVEIITSLIANPAAGGTLFVVPEGVTDLAMALVPNGGDGAWTLFPTAFYAGGGAGWASSDSILVTPGNQIRYRVVNWGDGRHEIQLYINGVNG